MARRTIFAQKEITIESEEVNVLTRTTNEFTANGSPVVTFATLPPPLALILAPVGAAPNAQGATAAATTLTLQPANYLFPGLITTLAQDFQGIKGFDEVRFNNGSIISTTSGQINVVLPSESNFKVNTKRILNADDLQHQPMTAFAIANSSFASLTAFPLPLPPGTYFDMTVDPAGYLLITVPGLYEFAFTNHAVNTNTQNAVLSFVPDATPLDPPVNLESSVANHSLVGIADVRNHFFTRYLVTAPVRMTMTMYAEATVPGNCDMNNTSIVVNANFRLA